MGPPPGAPPGPPPGGSHGAVMEDPNEPNIVDGKDFESLAIEAHGNVVRVRIRTYGQWAFRPFQSLYFKGGEKGQVHVKLMKDTFTVLGEATGRRGLFNVDLFEGKAQVKDNEYALEFPWQDAFGKSPEVESWVFSILAP